MMAIDSGIEQANALAVLPIACRFVPYDQWLVTHIDPSWRIRQLKQYLLSKCIPSSSYVRTQAPSPPQRPLSPIIFNSSTPKKDDTSTVDSDGRRGSTELVDWRNVLNASVDTESHVDEREEDVASNHDDTDSIPSNYAYYSASPQAKSNTPDNQTSFIHGDTQSANCPHHHSKFVLLTFSSTHLLEDDYALSWYSLRPYELLELHSAGSIVRLERESLTKYIEPFFMCKVRALRVVWKEIRQDALDRDKDRESVKERESGKLHKKNKDKDGQTSSGSSVKVSSKRDGSADTVGSPLPIRRSKIEWRERWIVISHGVVNLCKSRHDTRPTQSFPLASLIALRGSEHLLDNLSTSSPTFESKNNDRGDHIVCVKFHPPLSRSTSTSDSRPHSAHGSDKNHSKDGKHEKDGNVQGKFDPTRSHDSAIPGSPRSPPKTTHTKQHMDEHGRRGSAPGVLDSNGERRAVRWDPSSREEAIVERRERERERSALEENKDGVWVVLDMCDDLAYTNILRILHRHSNRSTASTFVPNSPSRPSSRSHAPRDISNTSYGSTGTAVPYPEWRTDVTRRARTSGLGDLGGPLKWVLCGDVDDVKERARKEAWRKALAEYVEKAVLSDDDEVQSEGDAESAADSDEQDETTEESHHITDSDSDDSVESEKEWDGWIGDLDRQRQVRKEMELELLMQADEEAREDSAAGLAGRSKSKKWTGLNLELQGQDVKGKGSVTNAKTTTTSMVSVGGRTRSVSIGGGDTVGGRKPSAGGARDVFGRKGKEKEQSKGKERGPVLKLSMPSFSNPFSPSASVRDGEFNRVDSRREKGKVRPKAFFKSGAEKLARGLDASLDFVEGK